MRIRLGELAKIVGGEISGDASVVITGVAGIREARPGDITFLADPRYSRYLETTKASAIIAARDAAKTSKPVIICDNPYLSFIKVVEYFVPDRDSYPRTIHP
ncbi:MAG TPA: UDP-3-O-(3-hydroxymyristoyl)glucosamine N-acyltransferase, partial [Firmicutes bacterium]|nr:UDP-3-O-(3-hydroxymyristoyl)glucosamine N-acyltransferase [Bacillota bacterium]